MSLWLCLREPRYDGRTLEAWLDDHASAPRQDDPEAARVIRRHPGPAIKLGLKLISTKENRVFKWLGKQRWLQFLRIPNRTDELQVKGLLVFEILGPAGEPAVFRLQQLLPDVRTLFPACDALTEIGTYSAMLAIASGATNKNPHVAVFAMSKLNVFPSSDRKDLRPYLATAMQSSDATVARSALTAALKCGVPLPDLEEMNAHPSKYTAHVRAERIEVIPGTMTHSQAKASLPQLERLLLDPDASIQAAASNVIMKIRGHRRE